MEPQLLPLPPAVSSVEPFSLPPAVSSVEPFSPFSPQLLEMATDRLQFSVAARRLFLADGSEVFSERDVPREAEVYVSSGEGFRDPYKGIMSKMAAVAERFDCVYRIQPN